MRSLFSYLAVCLFVLGALAAPLTAVADASGPKTRSLRIINGQPALRFHSPVVEVRQATGSGAAFCTGSVISRRAVLTAWHCVSTNRRDMSVAAGGRIYAVRRVAVHPAVRPDPGVGVIYNDIAVLSLRRDVRVPSLSLLVSRPARSGEDVRIIGYGLDQFGLAGVLRQGFIAVERVTPDFVVTLFQSQSQSDACRGDSGGPAILNYKDAAGSRHRGIVGTTSTGTTVNCTIGDETYYINIQSPAVLSFIKAHAPTVRMR